jgi:hypothetical protein
VGDVAVERGSLSGFDDVLDAVDDYPAGTVVLARAVLAERIHRGQLVGLGAAALAVSLLALT